MEPAIGSVALKAALPVLKNLPKLASNGRVAPERRIVAYERFSRAIWAVVESEGSVRGIEPIARRALGGFWYHPMFVRITERTLVSSGELLGAYGALRLVSPNAIVEAAEQAVDRIAELVATPVGDADAHTERQHAVGLAMISYDLLCRIDLGVDRHPSAPKLSWYNPVSWGRQLPWWWRARRGDWPPLSSAVTQSADTMSRALTSYKN